MSAAHSAWFSIGSAESPMIFTLRRSKSGLILAMYPSSVVQTGVKSFGWEKSTAHESPIQSWKLIVPSVVSASKSGAVSPIFRPIAILLRSRFDDYGDVRLPLTDNFHLRVLEEGDAKELYALVERN